MIYSIVIFVAAIAGFLVYIYQRKINKQLLTEIERNVRDKLVGANLGAQSVILVSKNETQPTTGLIETHRIYKDVTGQYYLYVGSNLDTGTLTPLSEQKARNALRNNKKVLASEFPDDPF